MGAKNVDIVFVIDASDSMQPCIASVVANINVMLEKLKEAQFNVRLDAVIHNVPGENIYQLKCLDSYRKGQGMALLETLYHQGTTPIFTNDVDAFASCLKTIRVEGDEHMLLALDCALDYPFGPSATTQRVVVLLSDEAFETNYKFSEHANEYAEKASQMVEKIQDRHISLYMVMPPSEIAQTLAEANLSDYVILQGGDVGLKSFPFVSFFAKLGKTISTTTAQQVREKPYQKSIMGQAKFVEAKGGYDRIGDSSRSV